jgi:hypothetical protein
MIQVMKDLTSTKIKFLQEAGTESMPHKNQSLFEHLVGVRDKLKNMGAPDHVQDAGLFHSIYGTDSYKNQTTNDRRKVKDLIGERAELLVYMFCTMPRPRAQSFGEIVDSCLRKELMMMHHANEEDMRDTVDREMTMEEAYGGIGFDSGRA